MKATTLRTPASGLLEAAEAVVARWDTPLWKDAPYTAAFIERLRTAIHRKAVAHDESFAQFRAQQSRGIERTKKTFDISIFEGIQGPLSGSGVKMPSAKAEAAAHLRLMGYSLSVIGDALNVSKTRAARLAKKGSQ